MIAALLGLLAALPDCGGCHRAEAAQWQRSAHATAATNPLFIAGHRHEPMQWCLSCHAEDPQRPELGIGCAACHVRDGKVLSSRPPSAAAERAHPMQHAAQLAKSEACAQCHQFNFPIGRVEPVRLGPHPMQNTYEEWRASGEQRSCQACHMPGGDHLMSGAHDVERLRGAIAVSVRRVGREARFELESIGVGHALPTGDPFRRLAVELCAEPSCRAPLASVELGRKIVPAGETWRFGSDYSLPASGAARTVELASREAGWWRVLYRYAAPSTERTLEASEREVTLFAGALER